MNQQPVSCIPNSSKMSKTKKVLEEAREIQNPELDLADRGVCTFEEMPGLFIPLHEKVGVARQDNLLFTFSGLYPWIPINNNNRKTFFPVVFIGNLRATVSCKYDSNNDTPQIAGNLIFLNLNMVNITRLTLSHNKIRIVPPGLANLVNLEILTLANNQIEDLPLSLSSMPKLRLLNLSFNRLYNLPRGFGAFPVLEVLDLTYNNLNEKNLPGNFFMMETLRALYLGDNDFEYLSPEIRNLKNLQILVLRENDLIELPKEIGELARLRELNVQGNRLTILPPEIGNLDMISNKAVFKLEGNEWVTPIADQLQVGINHLMDYLRSETYRIMYNRYLTNKPAVPPPCIDKAKKMSRVPGMVVRN